MKLDMVALTKSIKDRHEKFIKKYGTEIAAELSDETFARDSVYSKLIFIGRAFEKAGVSVQVKEVEIHSLSCFYNRSVAIVTRTGLPIYLLNGGDHVVVTDKIVTEDPLTRSLVMTGTAGSNNLAYKEYRLVMDRDFDWMIFGLDVLDIIHRVAYHGKTVRKRSIMKLLGEEDVIN